MKLIVSSKINNARSKWLLAAILLLILSTFSGLATVSQARQQTVHTTLVINNQKQVFKRSINFTPKKNHKKETRVFLSLAILNLNKAHNKQAIIAFKLHSGPLLPNLNILNFYHIKVTPPDSENNLVIS